jgi:hypothetical protein
VVKGKSLSSQVVYLEVSLVDKDANVFSWKVQLNENDGEYRFPLTGSSEGKFAVVPRPYPEFKPWYANTRNHGPLSKENLETLQVTLLHHDSYNQEVGVRFYLEEIWLE